MTLESIFAHIYWNKYSEFLLKLSYIEISEEHIYDLLDDGRQLKEIE